MSQVRRMGIAAALIAVLAAAVAGCGSSGGSSGVIIRGTTDQPVSYDPAGAYDLPSYDVIYAIYQNLMTIPPGESTPVPEAAQKCEYTDKNNQTYECTLKPDLKFSDGTPLTSKDVVFSFERNVKIADPNGGSSLLANMKSVEAKGPDTVIFHLKAAGRDLALHPHDGIRSDRPGQLPGRQAAELQQRDRLRPLRAPEL